MSIWLDVTTVWGWRRPALGIVRVEAEVARHFLQTQSPLIRFCRYDQGAGNYLEVAHAEIADVLRNLDDGWKEPGISGQAAAPRAAASERQEVPEQSRRDLWKQRARRAIDRLPPRPRSMALRWARQGYHSAMEWSARMRGAQPGAPHADPGAGHGERIGDGPCKLPAARRHPFEMSDVYISLGLDWDQKDLAFLYRLKGRLQLRVVLCCYDIIPILMPEICVSGVPEKFPRYFADVAWCADEIVCISECSLRDLGRYLESVGAPVPKMSVIRLGSELPAGLGTPAAPSVGEILKRPFILYVSTIEARKNHKILCQAYKKLLQDGVADVPRLVWVGMQGWGVDAVLADIAGDPGLREHIQILNHVSDDDLSRLYKNSLFTVYPSLYEGWGLPVAESLGYGKFCLASNAASIPEVGGSLVEYVDPHDAEAWARRLQWYFQSPAQVQERESEILASYRSPSWRETGDAVLSSARNLASV